MFQLGATDEQQKLMFQVDATDGRLNQYLSRVLSKDVKVNTAVSDG